MSKNKIVLDTNIWISAIIKREVCYLSEFIALNGITVYICPEMLLELKDVLGRVKFKNYLSKSIHDHIEDIRNICVINKISKCYNNAPR